MIDFRTLFSGKKRTLTDTIKDVGLSSWGGGLGGHIKDYYRNQGYDEKTAIDKGLGTATALGLGAAGIIAAPAIAGATKSLPGNLLSSNFPNLPDPGTSYFNNNYYPDYNNSYNNHYNNNNYSDEAIRRKLLKQSVILDRGNPVYIGG